MSNLTDAGGKCPQCGEATEVEGGPVQIDGDEAWQVVECLACGCVYDEVYRYVGAQVRHDGNKAGKR